MSTYPQSLGIVQRPTRSSLWKVCAGLACLSLATACSYADSNRDNYDKKVAVKTLLQTGTTVTGQPIRYPKTNSPELKMLLVELPPGAETGWHTHPMPCCAYILSGQITVEVRDRKGHSTKHTYRAGQAIAETVNTLHNGKNTGKTPVRILMTVVGVKDVPVAEKAHVMP